MEQESKSTLDIDPHLVPQNDKETFVIKDEQEKGLGHLSHHYRVTDSLSGLI